MVIDKNASSRNGNRQNGETEFCLDEVGIGEMVANKTGVDDVRVDDTGSKPYNIIICVVRSMIIVEFHIQRNPILSSHPLHLPITCI